MRHKYIDEYMDMAISIGAIFCGTCQRTTTLRVKDASMLVNGLGAGFFLVKKCCGERYEWENGEEVATRINDP